MRLLLLRGCRGSGSFMSLDEQRKCDIALLKSLGIKCAQPPRSLPTYLAQYTRIVCSSAACVEYLTNAECAMVREYTCGAVVGSAVATNGNPMRITVRSTALRIGTAGGTCSTDSVGRDTRFVGSEGVPLYPTVRLVVRCD